MTRSHVHEAIRARRLALDLTQEQAAERAGISRNEWNQMETGGRGVGPKNAGRFVDVLGGTTEEYLTRPSRPEISELRRRVAELEKRVTRLEKNKRCVP